MNQPASIRPATALIWTGLAVVFVQVWVTTMGTFTRWPPSTFDYSAMAEGFLNGHLSLLQKPAPQLLALPNPYDPSVDLQYALRDASLFNGKYYYYWGPVPVLPLTAVCWALSVKHPHVADCCLAIPFALGTFAMLGMLLERARARFYAGRGAAGAVLMLVSFGMAEPVLTNLIKAEVFQAAIFAAQFFLLLGIYALWRGLEEHRPRAGWLVVAGIAWALVAGSRFSLSPAIAALTIAAVWAIVRSGAGPKIRWPGLTGFVAPLAAGALAIGWYNQVRFDSIFECGLRYQLTGRDQSAMMHNGFFTWRNVAPDVMIYGFLPPQRWSRFPYLLPMEARPWLHRFMRISPRLMGEASVGLIWTQPVLLLALAGAATSFRPARRLVKWLACTLCIAIILGMAPAMFMEYTAGRYLLDWIPAATLLAAIGYWECMRWLEGNGHARWMPELRSAVRLVVSAQCAVGLLLALGLKPNEVEWVAKFLPHW